MRRLAVAGVTVVRDAHTFAADLVFHRATPLRGKMPSKERKNRLIPEKVFAYGGATNRPEWRLCMSE
jgi:hypothetical protein